MVSDRILQAEGIPNAPLASNPSAVDVLGSLLDALLLFYRLELFHVRQILCATARSLICDQIFKGNNRDLQSFDRNVYLVSIGLFEVNTADACDDVNSTRAVANLKDNPFD